MSISFWKYFGIIWTFLLDVGPYYKHYNQSESVLRHVYSFFSKHYLKAKGLSKIAFGYYEIFQGRADERKWEKSAWTVLNIRSCHREHLSLKGSHWSKVTWMHHAYTCGASYVTRLSRSQAVQQISLYSRGVKRKFTMGQNKKIELRQGRDWPYI